ncbi:hypothetical protein RHMOL_Rhmol01G0232600 [Rhododendron molle]|uniref:Uncharacterized protein n=1 Tax=Rhododendron molle TaxID=49168 RepID=A0ACC0Q5Y0_RHOML|nr:hypothetical protein RHMOL_Rhmol01G0232600 [Rhododendron molle]
MVVPVPFHRWVHVKHRNPRTIHGGWRVLLSSTYSRPKGDCCCCKLMTVQILIGFLGVDQCWYLRRISQFLAFAPTMLLPQGLRSSFEGIGRSTWILLRHGCKAWPIQVVDAVMQKGWREFRTAHGIAANYKLILMCERKWIFNAIIFDENDIEVSYNWTMLVNEHSHEFHTIQGNLITGCLPSTILRNLPLIKSGYYCIPGENYLEEFQTRLEPVLEDLNLQSISVRMGNRTWTISVDNGYLNATTSNPFLNALQLQVHDFVFIAKLPNLEVRVVILDAANDRERIYDWL